MVTAVATTGEAHPLASGLRELGKHGRGDRFLACALQHRRGAFCIDTRLVTNGLEVGDAVLEVGIAQVGNAALDGIVKPFEAQVCLRRPLVQLGVSTALKKSPELAK